MKLLRNPVAFVIAYIVFMIPTYILPYFGSNSFVGNALMEGVAHRLNPLFYLHLLVLLILVFIGWSRGASVDKKWLVIFPVLAAAFDLIPGLSSISLVPTIMHLLTIILGVVGTTKLVENTAA